jgi:hypothetical protein
LGRYLTDPTSAAQLSFSTGQRSYIAAGQAGRPNTCGSKWFPVVGHKRGAFRGLACYRSCACSPGTGRGDRPESTLIRSVAGTDGVGERRDGMTPHPALLPRVCQVWRSPASRGSLHAGPRPARPGRWQFGDRRRRRQQGSGYPVLAGRARRSPTEKRRKHEHAPRPSGPRRLEG